MWQSYLGHIKLNAYFLLSVGSYCNKKKKKGEFARYPSGQLQNCDQNVFCTMWSA